MLTLSFFTLLWISWGICAGASFFVFFARNLRTLTNGVFLFLTGLFLQFIATDIFSNGTQGRFIGIGILLIFTFEFLLFSQLSRICPNKKPRGLFYLLPFLAFLSMGLAMDLLTVLLGLTLFGVAFLMLAQSKGKNNLSSAFLKINVGLLGFAYGMAVLFSREGTIAFASLRLKLSLGNWDNWTTLGVGLLVMGVVIELYGTSALLRKQKK